MIIWSAPATDSMLATNLADMGARLYREHNIYMYIVCLGCMLATYIEKRLILFMKYRSTLICFEHRVEQINVAV